MLTEASLNVFNVMFPFWLQSGTYRLILRPQDHALKLTITNLKWALVLPVHPTTSPWQSCPPACLHNDLISQTLIIFSFLTFIWWRALFYCENRINRRGLLHNLTQIHPPPCISARPPSWWLRCLAGGLSMLLRLLPRCTPSYHPCPRPEDIRRTLLPSHPILPCL